MIYNNQKQVSKGYIKKISNIFFRTTGHFLWYLSSSRDPYVPEGRSLSEPWQNYLVAQISPLLAERKVFCDRPGVFTLSVQEQILYLPLYIQRTFAGLLVLGPVRTKENFRQILTTEWDTDSTQNMLIKNYLLTLPFMDPYQYESFLHLIKIISKANNLDISSFSIEHQLQNVQNVSKKKEMIPVQNKVLHHAIQDEAKFFQKIFDDDENFFQNAQETMQNLEMPPLAVDIVRSEKNRIIGANALFCREAIRLGADSEKAFNLSDHLVYHLELLNTYEEVMQYFGILISAYRNAIQESKSIPKVHPSIHKILIYMHENQNKPLRLHEIAEGFHMNYQYISQLFKQEMGCTFKEYETRNKTLLAMQMLTNTELTISEISEALGYSYSYYFTKTFKKVTGKLPTEYRRQYSYSLSD
ncbi:MAG: helix-turn-helix domain-containing protein [Lachnospiraceae bacterium]